MLTTEQVATELETIRTFVAADGADLHLERVQDGKVTLRLSVQDVSCLECVMPKELLSSLILTELQGRFPEVADVAIIDPRDE